MQLNNKHTSRNKYQSLQRVLLDALEQASGGKGKERHADGEDFENQKICVINRWLYGSPIAGPLFQVVKKTVESSRMGYTAAIRELYGAINYASAGIILLEELRASEKQTKEPQPQEPLLLEMNCICLGPKQETDDEINAEVRRIESKALAHVEEHGFALSPNPT